LIPAVFRCASTRRAFTLLEVLVALVILQVAMLGAVAALTLAHRLLAAAELLHEAAQESAAVADSLVRTEALDAGERRRPWGTTRWTAGGAARTLRAEGPDGTALLEWWIASSPAAPTAEP
jgi:type II secretory pathway pseudopilin PulG